MNNLLPYMQNLRTMLREELFHPDTSPQGRQEAKVANGLIHAAIGAYIGMPPSYVKDCVERALLKKG